MRLVLWGLLVFIVCLPLAFVLYLVAAARYPAMDNFTAKLPTTVGSAVSEIALRRAGFGKDEEKAVNRAIRLDPKSADAWSRLCHLNDDTDGDEVACRKAIALGPTAWNFNGLGAAQERAGDFCAAEESYTMSIQQTSNSPLFLRNMGRAALRCGHPGASVAGLEVAEGLDAKAATDPDDDDETKPYLLSDREYLAVAYDRTNQPDKAVAICLKAHSDWKSCHCELTDKDVKCFEGTVAPKKWPGTPASMHGEWPEVCFGGSVRLRTLSHRMSLQSVPRRPLPRKYDDLRSVGVFIWKEFKGATPK